MSMKMEDGTDEVQIPNCFDKIYTNILYTMWKEREAFFFGEIGLTLSIDMKEILCKDFF